MIYTLSTDAHEPVLDSATEQSLLLGLVPIAPPDGAALLKRVLARVRADAPELTTVRAAHGDWVNIAPGVEHKRLMRSANSLIFLLRMEAGSLLGEHTHEADEEAYCISGAVSFDDGIVLNEGDFHHARAGARHGAMRSEHGCMIYVRRALGAGAAVTT